MAAALDAVPVPQMLLRPMQESDLVSILEIEQGAYRYPWTDGIFRDCLRVGYSCVALELDVILVGYGVIAVGAGEAHLLNVCVREEFRSRGFGRALVEHLLQLAHGAAAAVVFLEVRPANTSAIRLYEQLGFHQIAIRPGYYQALDGREDALVMRRAFDAL